MARFREMTICYDPSTYESSVAEKRPHLDHQFRMTLNDDDCAVIAETLSIAEAEFFAVRDGPDQQEVLRHLERVKKGLADLHALLTPPFEEASVKDRSVHEAIYRLRNLVWDEMLQEGEARDGFSFFKDNVRVLEVFTQQAMKETASEKAGGATKPHLVRLLRTFAPLLKRHGKQTSFTTQSGQRHSTLADFVMEVGLLLPNEARPVSSDALVAQIVALRREENKRSDKISGPQSHNFSLVTTTALVQRKVSTLRGE